MAAYVLGFVKGEVIGGGDQTDTPFKIFNNNDVKLKLVEKQFKSDHM